MKALAFHLPLIHPIPRERRMAGKRIHRMDERRQSTTASSRPLPAALAGGFGILRFGLARGTSSSGEPSGHLRNLRLLLLPLLVQWPPGSGTSRKRNLEKWRT
jgi:hypothetical protein